MSRKKEPSLSERLLQALLDVEEVPQEDGQVADLSQSQDLDTWQRNRLRWWGKHPWLFYTGRDRDGDPIHWTKDERDEELPFKHFPGRVNRGFDGTPYEKPYLKEIFKAFRTETTILADKSRQMMLSYSALLYAHWDCSFHYGRTWLLSKNKDKEAATMLEDKVRTTWRGMPEWLKEALPISLVPADEIKYPRTGSKFLAVGQNVADAEARGNTASGVIVDEAAFQDHFPFIVRAVTPMASKLIAITTPNLGRPGANYFVNMLERDS